jgi:hypothetical protein
MGHAALPLVLAAALAGTATRTRRANVPAAALLTARIAAMTLSAAARRMARAPERGGALAALLIALD